MSELKPCPFCGGEAKEQCNEFGDCAIYCTKCGASTMRWYPDKIHAITKWNNRTDDWIPVNERLPEIYRNEYDELIPFLVCQKCTDYPFRAFFDGRTWGDGWSRLEVIAWQPLPEPYEGEGK